MGCGTEFDTSATLGSWYGYAGPFTTLTGGGGLSPVSLADSFRGMTIIGSWAIVPEPSSFALALLGGGLLVLFLRGGRSINPRRWLFALTIWTATASATSVLAQGTVAFQNDDRG